MGRVGDELTATAIVGVQPVEHVVHLAGERGDLVVRRGHRHPFVERSGADPPGLLGDRPHRSQRTAGEQPRRECRQQHRDRHGDPDRVAESLDRAIDPLRRRCDDDLDTVDVARPEHELVDRALGSGCTVGFDGDRELVEHTVLQVAEEVVGEQLVADRLQVTEIELRPEVRVDPFLQIGEELVEREPPTAEHVGGELEHARWGERVGQLFEPLPGDQRALGGVGRALVDPHESVGVDLADHTRDRYDEDRAVGPERPQPVERSGGVERGGQIGDVGAEECRQLRRSERTARTRHGDELPVECRTFGGDLGIEPVVDERLLDRSGREERGRDRDGADHDRGDDGEPGPNRADHEVAPVS